MSFLRPEGIALAALCAAAVLYARYWYAACDDAYIYLVYVRNLFAGNGLTYNGAQVLGFTSPLWMGILVLAGVITKSLPLAAEVISMACGVGVLVLVHRVTRQVTDSAPAALGAGVVVASCGSFAFYMGNGLETVLFSGLVLWAASILLQPDAGTAARSWPFAVVLALLVLGRPEGVAIATILLGTLAWWCRSLRPVAVAALRALVLLLPFVVALAVYYGSPVPITYFAKSGAGLSNLGQGLSFTERFLRWEGLSLVAALLVLVRRDPFGRARLPLASLLIFWVAQITVQGGDNMVGFRTYVPIVPLAAVIAIGGWHHWIRARGIPRPLVAAILVLALPLGIGAYQVASFNSGSVVGSSWQHRIHDHVRSWRTAAEDRRFIGEFLQERLPADAVIAVNAAGILPYYAALPTIDMLGLNDDHIARHGHRDRSLPYGHQAGDGAYVLGRRPMVIVFGGAGDARAGGLVSEREIWRDETFQQDYQAYRLPNGRWIFARRIP